MATIDVDLCAARMKRLMEFWNAGGDATSVMWGGATAVLVGTGVNKEDDLRYLKSVALEVWLFGYELPDTLMLLTKTELHVVTGGKKGASDRRGKCRKRDISFPPSLPRSVSPAPRTTRPPSHSVCAFLLVSHPMDGGFFFFKNPMRSDPSFPSRE